MLFMNLVVLGNVCIDKNTAEKVSYQAAGGAPIFMSLFFNKAKDAKFTTIASYGADFLPFKNNLNLYPNKPNIPNTLVYENTIKNGKRSQKCYFYNENALVEINENLKQVLIKAYLLFIAPLLPNFLPEYIKKITDSTPKDCLKILLPQGYFRNFDQENNVIFRQFKEVDSILPLVDIIILSSEDYPSIENLSSKWNKKHNKTFIITKAEKGAIIINKRGKVLVPTKPIPIDQIDDSIGAGDTFSASFGYYYFKYKDLLKAVKLANQSAREKLLSKT